MRLRRVFEHEQAVLARDGQDRIQVGRLAVQVDRNDDLGFRRDCGFDQGRRDVMGQRVRLDRHGNGAALAHRQPGRDIGIARHDDFIAWLHIQRAQRQVQCVEAVGDTDAERRIDVCGKLFFETCDLAATDILAGCQRVQNGRIDFALELIICRF